MKILYGLLSLFLLPNLSYAFEWQDLWQTPNQQAATLLPQQPAQAASLFTDKNWQAVAEYRAAEYEKAAKAFAKNNNANGFYNQGNALAKLGKFPEALKAYEQALKLQTDFADAQFNYDLVKKLLEQQKQQGDQSQENKSQESQPQENNQQQSDNKQQNEQSSSNNQQQQNSQQQSNNEQQQNSQQQPNNEQQQNSQQPAESKQSPNNNPTINDQQNSAEKETSPQDTEKNSSEPPPAANEKNAEQNSTPQNGNGEQQNAEQNTNKQATANTVQQAAEQQQLLEQWLQRVPDDPGGLLKQKFLRDYENYQQQQ